MSEKGGLEVGDIIIKNYIPPEQILNYATAYCGQI